MSTAPTTPPDPNRAPEKPPSAYRPDLRPILILALALLVVIIGWIILSPLMLPPAVR